VTGETFFQEGIVEDVISLILSELNYT